MAHRSPGGLLSFAMLILAFDVSGTLASPKIGNPVKSATFLSPEFVLGPGSVEDRYYSNIDFPRGHVGIKSFHAEVIDDSGNPIALHETYLHHWVVAKYHQRRGMAENDDKHKFQLSDYRLARNEIGNPDEVPEGFEEKWLLNVHAIDTRGAVDRLGCTECRCDLYNITVDEYGQPLRPGYVGGLRCCYDQTQCKVQQGYGGARRRYGPENGCQVEYNVESCSSANAASDGCIDVKRTSLTMPVSGYVIYGVAHQHTGGAGSTLYGEDGRVICSSEPIYGTGKDVGDEAGYIVGMSTCYPEPGSVQITSGENLLLESNYNSTQKHTGVMGLFYILVADRTTNSHKFLVFSNSYT
ncbi:hypothetical protein OIU78_030179 [Salix suchowensis]|nr:hypothetical protein OIU78_030179 [Salix suchowensis]